MALLRTLLDRRASPLSDAARDYRAAMWAALFMVAAALVLVIGGLRGRWPAALAVPAALALALGLLLAIGLGIRGHRRAIADRELQTHRTLIVHLAALLGKQDEDTLGRIAARDGPEGEAARLILAGRREAGSARD
ncbi:MAG TPA: hypothetical protein VNK43_05025 [Gemmatimonadales bacterium]|nr:hypothetical protein [Gemmatimonadales bacterium]